MRVIVLVSAQNAALAKSRVDNKEKRVSNGEVVSGK